MKVIYSFQAIVFAAVVAVAFAASLGNDKDAAVVRNVLNNIGTDGYSFECVILSTSKLEPYFTFHLFPLQI